MRRRDRYDPPTWWDFRDPLWIGWWLIAAAVLGGLMAVVLT